jgi:hypothetical protein
MPFFIEVPVLSQESEQLSICVFYNCSIRCWNCTDNVVCFFFHFFFYYLRLAYGGSCHFQQYFSHIVAAGFIGGEIREYPVKTTNLSEEYLYI